jgi:aspartyl protease family protein
MNLSATVMRTLRIIRTGLVTLLFAVPSFAADINLIGIFGAKATLMVDGGKPRTLAVGETSPEKIRLLSIGIDSAVVEIDGKRETLHLGNQRIAAARSSGSAQRVVLTGDSRGHFYTTVVINGASIRFVVDTGATSIAISADDARRANVRYTVAERGFSQTANGVVPFYRVKFDTVTLGDITLNNVDGAVMEGNALGSYGLLGMSFLSRTEMRRDGDTLTLTKRY